MNNLILTTAVGYSFNKIEIFIKSLRKFYDDEIVILINKNQTELKFLLKNYRIFFLEANIKKIMQLKTDFITIIYILKRNLISTILFF